MSSLLHALLTESAEKHSDKPAVVYKDDKVTYSGLNVLSNQLSAVCMDSGVETGGRVGVYIDKSIANILYRFHNSMPPFIGNFSNICKFLDFVYPA